MLSSTSHRITRSHGRIEWIQNGQQGGSILRRRPGLCDEWLAGGEFDWGDHHTPAKFDPIVHEACWHSLAKHRRPGCLVLEGRQVLYQTEESQWESATITTSTSIPATLRKSRSGQTRTGKVVTGGIVSVRDSSWLPKLDCQPSATLQTAARGSDRLWFYALFTDPARRLCQKADARLHREEITKEWLYHLGVPLDEIGQLAATGPSRVLV